MERLTVFYIVVTLLIYFLAVQLGLATFGSTAISSLIVALGGLVAIFIVERANPLPAPRLRTGMIGVSANVAVCAVMTATVVGGIVRATTIDVLMPRLIVGLPVIILTGGGIFSFISYLKAALLPTKRDVVCLATEFLAIFVPVLLGVIISAPKS